VRSLTSVCDRLLEKQKWICSLCKEVIEERHQATVDHTRPICHNGKKGGRKNMSAVHFKCNQIKSYIPHALLTPQMFIPKNRKWMRVLRKDPKHRTEPTELAMEKLGLTVDPYLYRWQGKNDR